MADADGRYDVLKHEADSYVVRLLHARDIAKRTPLLTRLVVRLFGRRLNRDVICPVILRAKERGAIDSRQLHELCAEFDRSQQGTFHFIAEG